MFRPVSLLFFLRGNERFLTWERPFPLREILVSARGNGSFYRGKRSFPLRGNGNGQCGVSLYIPVYI